MGLETATYISSLTPTNPVSNDTKSQGDDHIRLLKSTAQNTFPNASKPFYFPDSAVKSADFSVAATDQNKTFLITTASASVLATLPSLGSGDAGWECSFIKTNTGTNPYFIAPPSGTLQSGEYSGLAKARRCIPGRRTRALWTGSDWIVERVESSPIGTVKDYIFSSLPVGYEFPYGQTLSSASSNYPEFYAANASSGVMPDARGRVVAGKDDMGGTSADRLTNLSGGVNGDTLLATGGAESHTLTIAQMPAHDHGGVTGNPTTLPAITSGAATNPQQVANASNPGVLSSQSGGVLPNHVHTIDSQGGGGAHNNVQPTIIFNKIVVVE